MMNSMYPVQGFNGAAYYQPSQIFPPMFSGQQQAFQQQAAQQMQQAFQQKAAQQMQQAFQQQAAQQMQQPNVPYGPVAQPPYVGNQPLAAGEQPPFPGGPYSQPPHISPYQQTNLGQPQPNVPYGPVAQPPYVGNQPLAAREQPPFPGGPIPYSQPPHISPYQQTTPVQPQPVVSNGAVGQPSYFANRQFNAGGNQPLPVGQTPSLQQPPIWDNQHTIPRQQQSFPVVDNIPTSHEISDNSLEMQRLSIVKSFIEVFNASGRNSRPADKFRFGIKLSNEIEMIYEQDQTNHHSDPNIGELETCSQPI